MRRISAAIAGAAFGLASAGAAAAEPAFVAHVAQTGSEAEGVAIADVTGDGREDLLVQTVFDQDDENNWKLFVFPRLEDGTLGEPSKYATHEYDAWGQAGLGTGDLDGDADVDVAAPTRAGVDLYYQQNGRLEGPQLVADTVGAQEATIVDIDGDGTTEILVNTIEKWIDTVGPWHEGVYLIRRVDGEWVRSPVSPYFQLETEIADLNGDGRLDVAAIGQGNINAATQVRTFVQEADGTFSEQLLYDGSVGQFQGLETADVSGDGLADILVGSDPCCASEEVLVFPQVPGGVSATPARHPVGDRPKALEAGDVTGDGRADAIVLQSDGRFVYVPQQPTGGLGSYVRPFVDFGTFHGETHPMPRGLAVGDLYGDARLDLAVAGGDLAPGAAGVFEHVDGPPPDTVITDGPTGAVATSTASFSFTSTVDGSSFECALDRAAWTACESPANYMSVPDGNHVFAVRARRASGLVDPTPAERVWRVDTTAPDTVITFGPSGAVASNSSSFSFSTNEEGTTFRCSLDRATPSACSSPASYSALAEGSHTFEVWAIDAAGNVDASPASRTWTVDTLAPETTITSGPTGWHLSTHARFGFSSSEAGSFECQRGAAPWGSCTSPKHYTRLSKRDHSFRVRARDAAGNLDLTPAVRKWTIPLDDRALTPSRGWSRLSGTSYYLGTFSRSSTLDATLARSSVRAKRVVLVATMCPTCGAVKVFWNGALLKRVSLASVVTTRKRIIPIATFTSLRNARNVTIKVVSSGKRVEIDGLGVSTR